MYLLPLIIDHPGPDCSRRPSDRLCVATTTCEHALTPRMGRGDYHFTRCALDGGAEAFQAIPEPPASGPRRKLTTHLVADKGRVFVSRRRADCSQLSACEDAWTELHGDEQAKCPPDCPAYAREEAHA